MLDWELSTLGDPAADFVYHLLMYRMPAGMFTGLDGLDLTALGIPPSRNMSPPIAAAPAAIICPTSII